MTLQAPFPWFGGKSRVAPLVWQRFGKVNNYVEPFFGSGAILLGRPEGAGKIETINDADGYLVNFWRALKSDPAGVAEAADWPVSEADLHARHYWLVTEGRERIAAALGDPDGYDLQAAGWWVWGICSWIGDGWCSGKGPWKWTGAEWAHLSAGQGINRKLPHLSAGRGINRSLPHLSAGQGILSLLAPLADRLRRVRIAHGDWSRVCGDSVTWRHGLTAVFLDPPYEETGHSVRYTGGNGISADVAAWAREAGKRRDMRICIAGYEGEHDLPGWNLVPWKAIGGYGSQGAGLGRENAYRERLWFSPHCLPADQGRLL
jgi:hypothetical protein